jgi:hypothetical protein
MERVKRSYALMLDFYGARMVDWNTGELARTRNYEACFGNLNARFHNYLRITRVLKWLGEMNLEHLKLGFLVFFANEAIFRKTIPRAAQSLESFWLATLKQDAELEAVVSFIKQDMTWEEALALVRRPQDRGLPPSCHAAIVSARGLRKALGSERATAPALKCMRVQATRLETSRRRCTRGPEPLLDRRQPMLERSRAAHLMVSTSPTAAQHLLPKRCRSDLRDDMATCIEM